MPLVSTLRLAPFLAAIARRCRRRSRRRSASSSPRTNRHSWFGAWYERKCFRSRSEAEGGASLHRGFATPRWRIFAISLRDAADFAPDGVGPTSWRSLPFRRPLLVSDKIRLAPRPNHECRLVLKRPVLVDAEELVVGPCGRVDVVERDGRVVALRI